jgi:hypothetical protein
MRKLLMVLVAALPLVLAPAAQADVVTFVATEDTWVRSNAPTSTSGANDDEIWSMSSSPTERGYLKFSINEQQIPPGSTINGVTLVMTPSGKSYSGTSNGPEVVVVPNSWSESTLTYNTRPADGQMVADYGSVPNSGTGVAIAGVTGSWFTGAGTYSLSLRGDSTNDLGVFSTEAPGAVAAKPGLRVDFTPPVSGTPPTAAFTVSPASPQAGQAVTLDGSSSTCPDGRCTYEYTVNGSTLFPTGQVGTWTPAAAGTYNVTLTVRDSSQPPLVDTETKQVTVSDPPAQPQCSDGVNNDPAEDSNIDFPADLGCTSALDNSESPNPPSGTDPLPPGLTPVAAGTQEWNGTPGTTFSTSQCPHAIPYMQEGSTVFARFQRNPGEPQSAGGYRCEQQSSTYIQKGIYWFQWRARYPNGYEPSCASWCTMRQWHENTSDGGGPVYLATFMQNGRPQIDGQFVNPGSQSLDVDVRQWHVYTAQVNFQSGSSGWADLWIDGVYSGRTSTNVTATPSNSYDKYGTYGGDSNTTRTADYDWARAYRP